MLLAFRRQLATEIIAAETREAQEREYEQRDRAADASERDAEQRRITELYTRAVDQLGNDQAPVRLGGLHALERLAQITPDQRQTIVDVICAYLRMPYKPPNGQPPAEDAPAEVHIRYEQWRQELQVRMTAQRILAARLEPGRVWWCEVQGREEAVETFWPDIDLDLTEAQLHRLDLTDCHIRTAQFVGAQFSEEAKFVGAQFFGNACFNAAKFSESAMFGRAAFSVDVSFDGARVRPVEDRHHSWPATWSTRDACEGEEGGWLYLVLVEE